MRWIRLRLAYWMRVSLRPFLSWLESKIDPRPREDQGPLQFGSRMVKARDGFYIGFGDSRV